MDQKILSNVDMPENKTLDDGDRSSSAESPATLSPGFIVKEYLLRHVSIFRELTELRRKVSLRDIQTIELFRKDAEYRHRDGRIRKETNTSSSSAREPIMPMLPFNKYFII